MFRLTFLTCLVLSSSAVAQDAASADRCEASCHCPSRVEGLVCDPPSATQPADAARTTTTTQSADAAAQASTGSTAPTTAPVIVQLDPNAGYAVDPTQQARSQYFNVVADDARDDARRGKKIRNWGLSFLAVGVLAVGGGAALAASNGHTYSGYYDDDSTDRFGAGLALASLGSLLFTTGLIIAPIGGAKFRRNRRRARRFERLQLGSNGTGMQLRGRF